MTSHALPPLKLWHALGLLEDIALAPPDQLAGEANFVEEWLVHIHRGERASVLETLELVIVALDYVKDALRGLTESDKSQPPQPLPIDAESRRRRLDEISAELFDAPRPTPEHKDNAGEVTKLDPVANHMVLRDCLGLAGAVIARIGDDGPATFAAIAEQAARLRPERLSQIVAVAEALEVAVAYALARLPP